MHQTHAIAHIGDTISNLGENLDGIYQDSKGMYWFASNGAGVYCYDGQTMRHITDKHGLCSNFVWQIQEDTKGDLWFSTRDGICCLTGGSFVNYTSTISNAPYGKLKYTRGGLFFNHAKGVCFYDGNGFTNFVIHPLTYYPSPSDMNRPYAVYCTLVDKAGCVWFGTQEKGVCCYKGDSFIYYQQNGLNRAAVRCLFMDKAGTVWAGNNGAGLFRFTGKDFENVTEKNGLANPDFLINLRGRRGTVARPWAMAETDSLGLLVGTIDAGLWRLKNGQIVPYPPAKEVESAGVWGLYTDKKHGVWMVIEGKRIYRLVNGHWELFTW